MGGIGYKLPLPFQVFRKGTNGAAGEEQQQEEHNQRAHAKYNHSDAQHVVRRLEHQKTVQNNHGAAAVLAWKQTEAVVIYISPAAARLYDLADGFRNRVAVKRRDMLKIYGFYFPLFCKLHDEIADFKSGFRCNLKLKIRGIEGHTGRKKGSAVLMQQRNGPVYPPGCDPMVSHADGDAENRHGPQQRQHSDPDKFPP